MIWQHLMKYSTELNKLRWCDLLLIESVNRDIHKGFLKSRRLRMIVIKSAIRYTYFKLKWVLWEWMKGIWIRFMKMCIGDFCESCMDLSWTKSKQSIKSLWYKLSMMCVMSIFTNREFVIFSWIFLVMSELPG